MSSADQQLVKAVVTTYNRRSWAKVAIDSVLAQTHPGIHVVIVDDASTDGTAELARSYQERNPGKVSAICKAENCGVADTVRRGLEAPPDADFVATLNDDDSWLPTHLERQLQRFEARPELGLVHTEALIIDESGRPTGQSFSDLYGKPDYRDPLANVLRANHACASTLMFRRDLAALAASTLPDRLLVWDYYLMLLASGHSSIEFLQEPLAHYREAATGAHRADNRMWRDTSRARRKLFADHPELTQRMGGRSQARRATALLAVDVAIRKLREREWREYFWHSGVALSQRSPRAVGALLLHTAKELGRPAGQ